MVVSPVAAIWLVVLTRSPCGGYVSSWYVQIDNMYVWEVLEAIEIVTELKERSAPSDEVDIFDAYKR